ncbi:hypothetical protein PRZ48_007359 [Zasmidium cellare]|uniref:Heterokaryon incompatibility domain-containing protein n=1 Tax=Zasmidium cellare TaxID=395010 RepID=A0ABR0EJX5_ZASCE|nr:hypothetical protein PRZ48_007359 [Zasmidium cellare]
MEQWSEFQYTPLGGRGWIRVLTIYSRETIQNEDTFCCILEDVDLAQAEHDPYFALSYSWAMPDGNSSKSHRIYIGEHRVPVTQNLFLGLSRLFRPDLPVRLWIDAICINQTDIAERNEQVAQMSRIYACAKGVFAWLGEGDDEQAMCVLSCLGRSQKTTCEERHLFRVSDGGILDLCELRRKGTWTTDLKGRGFLDVYKIENDKNRRVYVTDMANALRTLLETRYFSRRWIVQEIYHARHVKFFWGAHHFRMKTVAACLQSLLDLINECMGLPSDAGDSLGIIRSVLQMLEMRQDADREGKVVPFHEIVAVTSQLACSDPRDIIFALTSLCPNCGLQPDYNMSVAEVYTAYSRQLIRHGMFEQLLQNIEANRPLHQSYGARLSSFFTKSTQPKGDDLQDLPTWALDLRKGFKLSPSAVTDPFYPPSDLPDQHSPNVQLNPKDNSLTCHVYFLGTIAKTTKEGFRLIDTVMNGKYNRDEARVKIEFPDAHLARKGDIAVAFDQSGSSGFICNNVMLLRKVKDQDAYGLLHWTYRARQELVDNDSSLSRVKEKSVVRIV